MKDMMLVSAPRVGRLWQVQSRTPMMNGPVEAPIEAVKAVMEAGAQVFEHNPANPEEKVELTAENLETPIEEMFPGNCATAEELTAAFANAELENVNLTAPIELTATINVARNVKFNGNGHKITFSGTGKALVFTKDSELKNVVVEGTLEDPATWSSAYGVQLYNGNYVVDGLTVTNMNAAMLCGGARVVLKGNVNVSGNGFGGIEVSVSESTDVHPQLDMTKAYLYNTTEEYAKPTVWIDSKLGKGTVVGADHMTMVLLNEQHQYYLDAAHTKAPAEEEPEVDPNAPTVTMEIADQLTVGTPTEFTVTTHKGNYEGMVKGTSTITKGEELIEKMEYWETNPTAGEGWHDLVGDTFGPSSGFPMMDATSKFRVTMNAPGEVVFQIQIVTATDAEVVCTVDKTITVVNA